MNNNNLSNSNNPTKIKSIFMIAAIASILIIGMNMNSAAYGSIIGTDGFPRIDDIGQSAECVGVAIECRENSDNIKIKNNNNNNNGNGGNGDNGSDEPLSCEECFREYLSEDQISQLLSQLYTTGMNTIDRVCMDISSGDISAQELLDAFRDMQGITEGQITDIFACLNLELPQPPTPN